MTSNNMHLIWNKFWSIVWYHSTKLYLLNNEKIENITVNKLFYNRRPIASWDIWGMFILCQSIINLLSLEVHKDLCFVSSYRSVILTTSRLRPFLNSCEGTRKKKFWELERTSWVGLFLTALYTMSTPLFFLRRAKRAKLARAPNSALLAPPHGRQTILTFSVTSQIDFFSRRR